LSPKQRTISGLFTLISELHSEACLVL